MLNILLVGLGEVAAGKAQVVNGVQQVCFADAILAANPDDALTQVKLLVQVIFELDNRYVFQVNQGCNIPPFPLFLRSNF